MSGLTFQSTRGPLTLRTVDHQVNCSEYEGILKTDPAVGFDTFDSVTAVPGNDILLSPDQVTAARAG
jgi:hypothetical protein